MKLDRFRAAFAGSNADAFIHGQDEDFAVTDLAFVAAAGAFQDGADRGLDEFIVNSDLQLDFAHQVERVLMAAESTDLAFLSTEALAIKDGQAKDFDLGQRLLDGFQLGGLNDRNDELHRRTSFYGYQHPREDRQC